MSSVDERVVSLKFDNQQFENGVKTSLGTLERLKQGLKIDKAAKGLDGLKAASKGFNMDSVSGAVDAVTSKFSILGTIGDQVLRNLTNSAINLGKNLITAIPNQIIEGGKRRAQNIEQAMFQLRGLLGEEEFAKSQELINQNINDAVAGTAYGYDAAAKVASQLKASNIDFGDDMKKSLRGVSGVAAMTNSSYEEIGHIFTTVAGQGKLMTMQLNQLAGRGLNVAATLAKAYGVTEAELRDMVTKGQVDFKSFAFAMDDAFGEHATKANETFSGALSNIKASLSRMGAKFATPIYDNLKAVFNKLLPIMKGIEKLINPIAEKFSKFLTAVVTPLNNWLEKTGNQLNEFLKSIGLIPATVDSVAGAASDAAKDLKDLAEIVQKVINGDFGNGERRKKELEELGYSYAEVQNKVNELLGSSKRYEVESTKGSEKVLSAYEKMKLSQLEMPESFTSEEAKALQRKQQLLENQSKILKQAARWTKEANKSGDPKMFHAIEGNIKSLREITRLTGPSIEDIQSKLGVTLIGFASLGKVVATVGKSIGKYIIAPFAEFAIPRALDKLFGLTSNIAKSVIDFQKKASKSKAIELFFINIYLLAGKAYESLQRIGKSKGVEHLTKALSGLYKGLKGTLGEIISFIFDRLTAIPELLSNAFDSPVISSAESVVSTIADALGYAVDLLRIGAKSAKQFFGSIAKNVGGAVFGKAVSLIGKIGGKIVELNDSLNKNNSLENFFNAIKSGLSAFGQFISSVAQSEGVTNLGDSLLNLYHTIKDFLGEALGFVAEQLGKLPGLFGSVFGEPSIEGAAGFVSNIANFLSTIIDLLSGGVGHVKNFFGAFKFDGINFDAIKNFFVKLGNSDGVQRLGNALKDLKDTLFEIGRNIFGKIGEKIGAIPGLFSKIDTTSISGTFSSALENIANFIGIIVEAVTGNIGAVQDFFASFDIKGDFSSKFESVKKLFDAVAGVSTSKFHEIADGIKKLFSAGGDDSKLGNTSKVLSSVTGIFDRITGDPKEIKSKSSASVSALGEGLLDGLSKINFDTVLKGAKIGAFLYIILQIAQTFRNVKDTSKNISDFTGSFSKFTKSLTKIPEGVTGVLDKMKETLGSYQTQLRADILFKVAAAIGILALSLIALSFVPSDKLANAAVDLALVVGVVALLILAISKLMKEKPEVTEKKENPYAEAINSFLKGISSALDNALKTLSKAGAFLMIAAAIGILVKAFTDLGQANMTVDQATQAVVGIIAISLLLVYLVGIMNQIASNFTMGSAASILAIGVAIKLISDVVLTLGAIQDSNQLMQGLGGVITLMAMLAVAGQAMGKAGPNVTKGAAAILIMTGALALIVPLVVLLGIVAKVATPGVVLLTILGGVMIGFTAALSAIGTTFGKQGNSMFKGAAMMLALAGAIAILAPMLVLLGAVAGIAFKGIGVLAAGLAVLIAAAAVTALPPVTAGLTALTTAITAFGLAMLETGVGVLAFAVGVAILVPIVKSVLSGVGEALSHLPELAATVISGIGQIFSMIWQAIVTYAPVLFNNLMQLIGQIPEWLVSQLPTIIAGLVSVVIQIDVALVNLLSSIPALLWGIIKGIAQGVVQGIASSAGPIGDALKGLLMGFINLIVDGLGGLISKIPGTEWITEKLEGWRDGMKETLKPSEAKETGEQYTGNLVKGAEKGAKGLTGVTTAITKVTGNTTKELGKQGDLAGEEYGHHLQYAVKQGRVDLEKETSDTASGMFEAFTSGNFDWSQAGEMINSDLFTGLQNGMEGMSGDFGDMFNGELISGLESIDVSDATGDIGKAVNEGVGDGVSSTMNLAVDPTKEMAEMLPEEFRNMLGINSPSKVFSDLGSGIPEGTAKGINKSTPMVKVAVTKMAMDSLKVIQTLIPQFSRAGVTMGNGLAAGLRSASGAVRSAASSLGSSARSGASGISLYSLGRDAAQGYINGIKSKLKAAYDTGASIAKNAHKGAKDNQKSNSPSKVFRNLGHDAMDGYILGFKDRITTVATTAATASQAGIDATKDSLKAMADAISGNLDLDPTIKPVLDLTDIKNGAGMINSLLPNGSVGLGLAVAGTAPGATYRMTNEDVVSAINGLRDELINNPQTVNNYSMGNVTYDDGSNVATAVRSLIRAARTERRV